MKRNNQSINIIKRINKMKGKGYSDEGPGERRMTRTVQSNYVYFLPI